MIETLIVKFQLFTSQIKHYKVNDCLALLSTHNDHLFLQKPPRDLIKIH